jgi:cell division protein FtsB
LTNFLKNIYLLLNNDGGRGMKKFLSFLMIGLFLVTLVGLGCGRRDVQQQAIIDKLTTKVADLSQQVADLKEEVEELKQKVGFEEQIEEQKPQTEEVGPKEEPAQGAQPQE